jgi:ABC-type transport system substrate-binding protein
MKVRRSVLMLASLLALAALVVGVAACGSSSSTSSSSPASTTPVKGGTFTVTFQGEPTGLDPAIAWEV